MPPILIVSLKGKLGRLQLAIVLKSGKCTINTGVCVTAECNAHRSFVLLKINYENSTDNRSKQEYWF